MTSIEVKAMSFEDRLAIHDLFVRYTTALDAGDVKTVVDCFTEEAALESPVIGSIAGRDAIRAFAERFAAQRAGGVQFRHMITNIAAEIEDSGNRARASTYLLVLITQDGKSRSLPPAATNARWSRSMARGASAAASSSTTTTTSGRG